MDPRLFSKSVDFKLDQVLLNSKFEAYRRVFDEDAGNLSFSVKNLPSSQILAGKLTGEASSSMRAGDGGSRKIAGLRNVT